MKRALELAEIGVYTTSPNPRVGCVLTQGNRIVGEGWHHKAGKAHAEVNALYQAGEMAKGATAYVTLEPCSHQGRTGPCAQALSQAGVKRVVVAMLDPNPLVSGRGAIQLEQAGIKVEVGLFAKQAEWLNRGFCKRMRVGRPWLLSKHAMSLDGRTAMANGQSQWITGPLARADGQRLRALSDAIICGIDTVLQDDCALTLRAAELALADANHLVKKQPLRVLLDSHLRVPLDARLLTSPGKVLIVCTTQAQKSLAVKLQNLGHEVLQLPSDAGRVSLTAVVNELGKRHCNYVLLETGAKLSGAFLQAKLIDELIIYLNGSFMGSRARPLMDLPFNAMSEKVNLKIDQINPVGDDWRIRAFPDD